MFDNCRDLEEALEMGVDWSLREGYAWAEDKEHCEEYGRMLQADPNKVSSRAKKRGLPQVMLCFGGAVGAPRVQMRRLASSSLIFCLFLKLRLEFLGRRKGEMVGPFLNNS